jgi:hypothetical protein
VVNTIASDGDTVIVGPGTYGDLDRSGTLGDSPGEETGGFGCMVVIARPVTLLSSAGAAATIIDASTVAIGCNVGIVADGVRFGKAGKGFGVTQTHQVDSSGNVFGDGLQINATGTVIAGNQVVFALGALSVGDGIHVIAGGQTLIEGNQVTGWDLGLAVVGDTTVAKSAIERCSGEGIDARGSGVVTGNVLSGNSTGIFVGDQATVTGNAFFGRKFGVSVGTVSNFTGTVERNTFAGLTCAACSTRAARPLPCRTTTGALSADPVPHPPTRLAAPATAAVARRP